MRELGAGFQLVHQVLRQVGLFEVLDWPWHAQSLDLDSLVLHVFIVLLLSSIFGYFVLL